MSVCVCTQALLYIWRSDNNLKEFNEFLWSGLVASALTHSAVSPAPYLLLSLIKQLRLVLNSRFPNLGLMKNEITGVCHFTRLQNLLYRRQQRCQQACEDGLCRAE